MLEPGFKMTELGPLPEEWEVAELEDLAKDTYSGGTPSTKKKEWWDGDIPWTTTAIIGGDETFLRRFQRGITQEGLKYSSTKIVPEGCILIGTRVGVGKAVVTTFDVAINQDITGFIPKSEVVPEFLVLYIKTSPIQRWFENNKRGATIKGVPRKDILTLLVPLPPLLEQRGIAHVLQTVQRAREATEAVIAAAKKLKRSLMRHLFTYGPVPVDQTDQVKLKDTEIGPVPEEWEVVKLGEIAKIERGKFAHRPRNDPRFYGGKTPFIQTGDVANSGGRIRKYTQSLNELGLSISRIFPKNTIVITIAANIGFTGILEFDSAFPDSLIGITPEESIDAYYLEYYLRTQREDMDRKAPKGTQKNINIEFLRPWPVSLPPLPTQHKIAEILSTVDLKIETEQARKAALDKLFKSLLANLMSGKIRVKVRENLQPKEE